MLEDHSKPAVRSKQSGLLCSDVLLQQDNKQHHIAGAAARQTMNLRLECLLRTSKSRDLEPYDYHVFEPVTVPVGAEKFSKDEEIKESCA